MVCPLQHRVDLTCWWCALCRAKDGWLTLQLHVTRPVEGQGGKPPGAQADVSWRQVAPGSTLSSSTGGSHSVGKATSRLPGSADKPVRVAGASPFLYRLLR